MPLGLCRSFLAPSPREASQTSPVEEATGFPTSLWRPPCLKHCSCHLLLWPQASLSCPACPVSFPWKNQDGCDRPSLASADGWVPLCCPIPLHLESRDSGLGLKPLVWGPRDSKEMISPLSVLDLLQDREIWSCPLLAASDKATPAGNKPQQFRAKQISLDRAPSLTAFK